MNSSLLKNNIQQVNIALDKYIYNIILCIKNIIQPHDFSSHMYMEINSKQIKDWNFSETVHQLASAIYDRQQCTYLDFF